MLFTGEHGVPNVNPIEGLPLQLKRYRENEGEPKNLRVNAPELHQVKLGAKV